MSTYWTTTYRYIGNEDEEGEWIYEEYISEHETEEEAWEAGSSRAGHSEALNRITIDSDDDSWCGATTWELTGNLWDIIAC